MPAPIRHLVLLPGMDGTGLLFTEFVKCLSAEFKITVARYPADAHRSYSELVETVFSLLPRSEPYALLAESFSTPIAIQCAASNPANLRALIICAGFVSSPLSGWKRFAASLLAPIAFRFKLPNAAASAFLIGHDATQSLMTAVQSAVSSVQPRVLLARLRAILACDERKGFARVVVPVLYLRATQDRLVGNRNIEEMVSIRPDTEVISFVGPHLLIQRHPRKTAEVVAGFLRSL